MDIIISVKRQPEGGYLVNGEFHVPDAPGNRDYRAVQEWIAAGNTPEPWETQPERLQRVVMEKRSEIEADFAAVTNQLRAGYSPDEIASWDQQIREARAYQADPLAPVPLLQGILAERADLADIGALVARVLEKADAFAARLGPAMGRKQARYLALEAIDLTAADAEAQIAAV